MDRKIIKHDQEMMRKVNKQNILDLIREKSPISRAELAKLTKMSPTSVSRIVSELMDLGLIKESEFTSGKVGRKALLLDTIPDSVYVISVQIDLNILRFGIVDFNGSIVKQHSVIYNAHDLNWTDIADLVCNGITQLTEHAAINSKNIIGLGVGVPGLIDTANGFVLFSPQLRWENVQLANYLREKTGYDTIIENIIKAKALAENTYGLAKNKKLVAFVHFGSGVGSALIMNSKIYRGVTNSAGEIGHTTIDPNGRLCDCGRRGCLQTYITEHALMQEARTIKNISSIHEIYDASDNNEKWAQEILNKLYIYMSITICNTICMYNPDSVIISGKLTERPQNIETIIKNKVNDLILPQFKGSYELNRSTLGESSGLLGISILCINKYLSIEL